jgi:hypothetical protein
MNYFLSTKLAIHVGDVAFQGQATIVEDILFDDLAKSVKDKLLVSLERGYKVKLQLFHST